MPSSPAAASLRKDAVFKHTTPDAVRRKTREEELVRHYNKSNLYKKIFNGGLSTVSEGYSVIIMTRSIITAGRQHGMGAVAGNSHVIQKQQADGMSNTGPDVGFGRL